MLAPSRIRPLALALLLLALAPIPARAADPVPLLETEPLFDDEAGGNADGDDPAIWTDPRRREDSLVIATKKDAGLSVFDLEGRTLQEVRPPAAPSPGAAAGRFNNVDLVRGFALGSRRVDLAVVSDRGRDRLRAYAVDPGARAAGRPPLEDVTAPDTPRIFSADEAEVDEQATAYGLAAWRDGRGGGWVVASRRNRTALALLRLVPTEGGRVTVRPVAGIELPSSFALADDTTWSPCAEPGELPQVEGMVVDARRRLLFAAQEDVGIWAVPLAPEAFGAPRLLERVREFGVPGRYDPATEECVPAGPDPGAGGARISADVEGLAIYDLGGGRGYLLASSQGDDTFTAFGDRGLGAALGTFRLADGPAVDGVQESDGAAVSPAALGPRFPRGLLVTHDGDNTPEVLDPAGEARANTNFKLTRWEDVAAAFDPPLEVRPR